MSHVRLVSATSEHILVIKNWFNSFEEIHRWGGPQMTYPMSEQTFLALLTQPHLNCYVLVDDADQLLAFGQYYMRLDRRHLGRLVVNPTCRGQGVGKLLVTELLKSALKQQAAIEASLFVFTDNPAAYGCYQSLGFVETVYPGGVPGNMPNCIYMVLAKTQPFQASQFLS
jgi:ribosomal protein S18 acetylase RimI-like enzyme